MSVSVLAERLRRRPRRLRGVDGQSGTTLIELMVALTAGLVVFGAIVALLLMTIRQSGRVTSHVEANQRARTTMAKIVNELNSACYFPRSVPVQAGSTGSKLIFLHQSGEAVAPTPTQSTIELNAKGELVQNDKNPTSGGGNTWVFPESGGTEESLMKGIAPLEESGPIFTYYKYSEGKISSSPLVTPLEGKAAGETVQVDIGFRAGSEPPISNDENSATGIQDSVLLRLTPPSYNTTVSNPPCE